METRKERIERVTEEALSIFPVPEVLDNEDLGFFFNEEATKLAYEDFWTGGYCDIPSDEEEQIRYLHGFWGFFYDEIMNTSWKRYEERFSDAKAKDKESPEIWRYGIPDLDDTLCSLRGSFEIVPSTVCENTGLICGEKAVYEYDWLEVTGLEKPRRYLVKRGKDGFRAFEDEIMSFGLEGFLLAVDCRIVGNLYD